MMLSILLALVAQATNAQAACKDLAISSYSQSPVNFNTSTAPSVTVTVTRGSKKGCDFFLTFDYGDATSFSGRRLDQGSYTIPMDVYKDAARTKVIKKIPDVTSANDVITGTFPDDTTNPSSLTVTFYPQLGSLSYNRFGTYSETLVGRLYDGSPTGSSSLEDSRSLTFQYTMAKAIDLSLVSTGGAFNVNDTSETLAFGVLAAGQTKTFDIVLKYNAGYRVRVSSVNQGKLKHSSYADLVPYTLTVNSGTVNLSGSNTSPVQVATGTGVSGTNGLSLASSVVIGTVGNVRAGNYSDTVTVTVTTTE